MPLIIRFLFGFVVVRIFLVGWFWLGGGCFKHIHINIHSPFNNEYSVKPQEALFCPTSARVNSKSNDIQQKVNDKKQKVKERV